MLLYRLPVNRLELPEVSVAELFTHEQLAGALQQLVNEMNTKRKRDPAIMDGTQTHGHTHKHTNTPNLNSRAVGFVVVCISPVLSVLWSNYACFRVQEVTSTAH